MALPEEIVALLLGYGVGMSMGFFLMKGLAVRVAKQFVLPEDKIDNLAALIKKHIEDSEKTYQATIHVPEVKVVPQIPESEIKQQPAEEKAEVSRQDSIVLDGIMI